MKEKIIRPYNLIGIVILLLAVILWIWPFKEKAFSFSQKERSVVEVDEATRVNTSRTVTYSGVTRSEKRASIGFTLPGRLISRPVEVGENVKKGQVLARLDAREFRNAVNMAEASVNELSARVRQAERQLNRFVQLSEVGAASSEELELSETALETLQAALDSAKVRLNEACRIVEESIIAAPFSGTVTGVMAEPGEWTGPGTPVISLAGDGDIELKVEVPENTAINLIKDQDVKVILPNAGNRQVNGRIKSIARAASGPGRLFPVIINLGSEENIFSGMTAELAIDIEMENSISVPLASILNPGSSRPYIFSIENGSAKKIPVNLGAFNGDRVIVMGDVSIGDRVVVAGHTMLADGDHVEITR